MCAFSSSELILLLLHYFLNIELNANDEFTVIGFFQLPFSGSTQIVWHSSKEQGPKLWYHHAIGKNDHKFCTHWVKLGGILIYFRSNYLIYSNSFRDFSDPSIDSNTHLIPSNPHQIFHGEVSNATKTPVKTNIKQQMHYHTWIRAERIYNGFNCYRN